MTPEKGTTVDGIMAAVCVGGRDPKRIQGARARRASLPLCNNLLGALTRFPKELF
jgi:hypothetical protein